MFHKFSLTFSLMKNSWQVLKKDKEIMFFPIISTIISLSLIAAMVYTFYSKDFAKSMDGNEVLLSVYLILFALLLCFIVTIFNVGIIACANIRLQGGDPIVRDGLQAMGSLFFMTIVWVIAKMIVEIVINAISSRAGKAQGLVDAVLDTTWKYATFFVLPLMVIEKLGPKEAFKESAAKLQNTWGEHLISNFSFGIILMLASLPGIAAVAYGVVLLNYVVIGIGIFYCLAITLISTTLETIFRVVLYYYIYHDFVHSSFSENDLKGAYSTS